MQAPRDSPKKRKDGDRLIALVFGILSLLFVAFIAYASLTPSNDGAQGGLFDNIGSIGDLLRGHNLRDIATNVLLYLPLGVFVALAKSSRGLAFLSPFLLVGTIVSIGMETTQRFIGRTPDLVDVITNTSGYLLGYWLIVVAVRVYGLSPRVFMGLGGVAIQDQKTQSIGAFRFIAICLYALVALLPFDISVKLGRIYEQLLPAEGQAPRLILDPFFTLSHWSEFGLKMTGELWALVPIAGLSAMLASLRGRSPLVSALFATVFVTAFCEGAQVFVLSRRTDLGMVFVAIAAALLGWLLVRSWLKLQSEHHGRVHLRTGEIGLALLGYAIVILFFAWSPFQFETDIAAVFDKVRSDTNIIPFRQHFSHRSLGSAIDIVKEALLFVPFGLLAMRLAIEVMPRWHRRYQLFAVLTLGGGFACFSELSQAVCIGRYIDTTDVILGTFGALVGATLLQLFMVRAR